MIINKCLQLFLGHIRNFLVGLDTFENFGHFYLFQITLRVF